MSPEKAILCGSGALQPQKQAPKLKACLFLNYEHHSEVPYFSDSFQHWLWPNAELQRAFYACINLRLDPTWRGEHSCKCTGKIAGRASSP